jgi:hypothetical protein
MANEGLGDQVKAGKELRGLMSDTGKIYSEIRKLGKDNEKILCSTLSKARQLWIIEAQLAKAGGLNTVEAKKFQKTQEKILRQSQDRLSLQESFDDASKQSANRWQDLQMQAAAFAGRLWGIVTNPLVLLIAGVALIGKMFVDWNKRGEEFRVTTGIVGEQFANLNRQAMSVAAELGHLGISQKEALEYTQALAQEFGSIDTLSQELVENVAVISISMGISADEATKLMSSFMTITAGSSEMAGNLMEFTAALSRSAKVAPNAVMQDIASNADALAGYMKEGGKNIAIAAVNARQLGVSIGQTVQIADKLLDFESSIESQMNAMLLTGRQLNLDRARMLAISGDLAGMQEEILRQVGSQAEFEEMNVIQRRALADAIGIGVGELGTMISRQDTLNKLTSNQIGLADAMAKGMTLTEVLGTNDKIMSGLTQMTNMMTKIGNIAGEYLIPVFEHLANVFGKVAQFVSNMLDGFEGKEITDDAKKAEAGFWDWTGAIGYTTLALGALIGAVFLLRKVSAGGGFFGRAKGGLFGNLFGGLSWSSLGKGIVIMLAIGAALVILAYGFKTMGEVNWDEMWKAGVAIIALTAAIFGLGALLSGPGAVIFAIGVAGFIALGLALNVLGEGISKIGTGFTLISTSLETIANISIPDFSAWDGLIDRVERLSSFAMPLALVAGAVTAISETTPAGAGVGAAEREILAAGVSTITPGTGEVKVSLDDVVSKLDEIEGMFRDGIDLKLNGAKIGEWLSKTARV